MDNGVEEGKWALLVLNVPTLAALLGAVLLEGLCESAAGRYLTARMREELTSRGLLGLISADRAEPASPAPTPAELELRRAPESDDFDVDIEEEQTDEEEEIVGSSNASSSSRGRRNVPPPARRAMKPFGVGGARATPSAAARAQLRSSFSTSTPPSTELTVALLDGVRGFDVPEQPQSSPPRFGR